MHLPKLASRLDLAMVLLRLMSSLSSQWQETMTVDGGSTYVRTWVLRGVNRNVYIVLIYRITLKTLNWSCRNTALKYVRSCT